MKKLAKMTGCVLGLLILGAALPSGAWAQTTSRAVGMAVTTPVTSMTSPVAQLPGDGSMATDNTPNVSVDGLAGADNLFTMATGGDGSAESNSTLENVSLLNGLITANSVVALASSWLTNLGAGSNASGSQLDNLVVNGVSYSSGVAPNTRVNLPGTGYVVLNEQQRTGDGINSSGITVNMIHVVLVNALTGAQTGDIIVGSATSQVSQ
ncbi:MAG TPA: choice-of-anchor P family protein [Gemmatimonadales bacterium]|nr:choice-of-anchor P family protein [Gemmatimonadales bacterium]